jgi:hypothetical protein
MNKVVSITRLSVIREGPSEVICPRRLFVPDRNIVLSMLPTSLLPALWWVAVSTVAATQTLAAESTADGVLLSKGAAETVVTPAPHDPVSPAAAESQTAEASLSTTLASPPVPDTQELTTEVVEADDSSIAETAQAFAESELVFVRGLSNAPFLPVALLGSDYYDDAMVSEEGATPDVAGKHYQVSTASQYAGVPFLLNKRSMVVLGEYLSYADFSVENGEDFSTTSAAIAAGYLYQLTNDWQLLGGILPVHHRSSLGERRKDYWQVMGGALTRYTRNDRLWWLFGVVFDDSEFGTTWLPYIGASLIINQAWSVSALLPWPQVIYAPSKDWFVSAGASYSGSSWAVNSNTGAVGLNLSGFDFGVGGARRLKGALWIEAKAGVGGLRGLSINDGDISGPAIDVSSSPFISISLTLRPSFAD